MAVPVLDIFVHVVLQRVARPPAGEVTLGGVQHVLHLTLGPPVHRLQLRRAGGILDGRGRHLPQGGDAGINGCCLFLCLLGLGRLFRLVGESADDVGLLAGTATAIDFVATIPAAVGGLRPASA